MTRTHAIRRIAGIVSVALGLAVATPAGARPDYINAAGSTALVSPTQSSAPAVQPNPDEQSGPAHPLAVHVSPAHGFSWGDAAIGGAAVLIVLMVAVGGTRAMSRRARMPRTVPSPSATR